MKRKLAIVLCVALLLASFGVMNASAATTPTLSLSTSGTEFHRGDIVSVDVNLSGEAGSGNAGIDAFFGEIVYDPLVFGLTKASAAVDTDGFSWLDSTCFTSGTLSPNTGGAVAGGTLDLCLPSAGHLVAIYLTDSTPLTADSKLFTINFTVLADATFAAASFTWASAIDACDPTSATIAVEATDLSVTIVDTAHNPIVTGVVDGKTYLTDRTISFDYGTATIATMIKSSGLFGTATAFTSGSTFTTEGRHQLIVTGTSGFSTTIVFNLYKGYIKGISVAQNIGDTVTYVSTLISKIAVEPGQTVSVLKADGTAIATPLATTKVATAMIVKVFNGETEVSSQLVVVYGDINGDGSINVGDLTQLKFQMANSSYTTGAKREACNANRDASVNVGDLTRLKLYNGKQAQIIQY